MHNTTATRFRNSRQKQATTRIQNNLICSLIISQTILGRLFAGVGPEAALHVACTNKSGCIVWVTQTTRPDNLWRNDAAPTQIISRRQR